MTLELVNVASLDLEVLMNLKEAIKLAMKRKKKIKSKKLSMYKQSAKSLIYWLFIDTKNEYKTLTNFLDANDWELEK